MVQIVRSAQWDGLNPAPEPSVGIHRSSREITKNKRKKFKLPFAYKV